MKELTVRQIEKSLDQSAKDLRRISDRLAKITQWAVADRLKGEATRLEVALDNHRKQYGLV